MAALGNLTSVNGESTPVTYQFSPLGPDDKGTQWFEQTSPAPINGQAAARFSASLRRSIQPGGKLTGIARAEFAMWIPTMETVATGDSGIAPPPTTAYTCAAREVYMLPERSTKQERKNLRVLFSSTKGSTNPSIVSMVEDLQNLY